ncbi:MAG: Ribosomal protein L11 methyltransferase [uncultured Solirubrobacteraceae bacterium]|uniref:Ribosomal protein L11 methyltransferase n=1 Tax=uncultured Solirubrobacteraceae bacterium TaxID=1162706 RepID=A0A6J4TAV5_9ACTN|nr:MAG: Ribosomal protein L11 methyltransferase [uncultured Solirubrobacteraceae bacterium]
MIALRVRVSAERAEIVLAELLELAPAGVEEREAGGAVEYVIYAAEDELPGDAALRAAAGGSLLGLERSEVADDWSERWKHWHQPVTLAAAGRRLRIRPPWEPPAADADIELVIDPGQAFGTGGHHTTRLCLELLLEREPGGSLADWGCGTGVLALAAARLGWSPVTAVDFDPAATDATQVNAEVNGISGIAVGHADLVAEAGPVADTVVANLVRPLLLRVAERLETAPRVLIASGLLREEADEVVAAFARHGLRETGRRHSGEWAAVVLEAEGSVGASRPV